MAITHQIKDKMAQALEHFKIELQGIRTGRANPAMVENLSIEVYGTAMRLRDIASITAPEARQLLIQPFDGTNTPIICKAIEKANLGFNPQTEGSLIRINIPPMDKSMREKMVKVIHSEGEKAKVVVRNLRRDANDESKAQKKKGDLTEDDLKRLEKEIQDLTDRFCKDIDSLSKTKEDEVQKI